MGGVFGSIVSVEPVRFVFYRKAWFFLLATPIFQLSRERRGLCNVSKQSKRAHNLWVVGSSIRARRNVTVSSCCRVWVGCYSAAVADCYPSYRLLAPSL